MSDQDTLPTQTRDKFDIHATFDQASGEFEIMAMTPGNGNGWVFSEAVLRESLALWDGAAVFVNHLTWLKDNHNLRDLGGVCHSTEWSTAPAGVKTKLKTQGPSGPLLDALGREMLSDGPKARVGFSGDVGFAATGKDVKKILHVYSLDCVFDPARGGAFLRALNSIHPWDDSRRESPGVNETRGGGHETKQ